MKKTELQKEGFDPDIVKDPLYFFDRAQTTFVPLTRELYEDIIEGRRRI